MCDTVPPCRAHVHMFTIIQFLRARANSSWGESRFNGTWNGGME